EPPRECPPGGVETRFKAGIAGKPFGNPVSCRLARLAPGCAVGPQPGAVLQRRRDWNARVSARAGVFFAGVDPIYRQSILALRSAVAGSLVGGVASRVR